MLDNKQNKTKNLGIAMLIAGWVLMLVLISMLYSNILSPKAQKIEYVNGQTEIKLFPSIDGHYRIKSLINQEEIELLIDTGASMIAIPENLANKLKLKKENKIYITTAGGQVAAYATTIENLTIGPIKFNKVKATIIPRFYSDDALLGMNILRKFDIEHKKDSLTLKIRND